MFRQQPQKGNATFSGKKVFVIDANLQQIKK
jgi:hypothetical protein